MEKENINQQNQEIKKITQRKEELLNHISTLKLKILKEEGEQKKLQEEYNNAEKKVNNNFQLINLTNIFCILYNSVFL